MPFGNAKQDYRRLIQETQFMAFISLVENWLLLVSIHISLSFSMTLTHTRMSMQYLTLNTYVREGVVADSASQRRTISVLLSTFPNVGFRALEKASEFFMCTIGKSGDIFCEHILYIALLSLCVRTGACFPHPDTTEQLDLIYLITFIPKTLLSSTTALFMSPHCVVNKYYILEKLQSFHFPRFVDFCTFLGSN